MGKENGSNAVYATNPIQIRHSRIVECFFKANPAFAPIPPGQIALLDSYPVLFQSSFARAEAEDAENTFQGSMLVELKEGADGVVPPYFFRFVVEGMFQFVTPEEPLPSYITPERLATVHGSAALMSLVREQLAQLSSRSSHGSVFLPGLLFGLKKEPTDAQASAAPPAKARAAKKERRK